MSTVVASASESAGDRPAMRRGTGLGLDLEGSFYAPGLLDGRVSGGGRLTTIELAPAGAIKADAQAAGTVRLSEWRFPNGRLGMTVDRSDRGYHIWGQGSGRYLLSPDGGHVRAAPAHVAAWRWQRFLVGQVLPFAALLHGLEVIHASAVVTGGRAVAFTGGSATGKSSLALNMTLRGARFLTDDVVALEVAGSGVQAHPGPGLASVRLTKPLAVSSSDRGRLGRIVGETEDEARIAVAPFDHPVPVDAVCFIEHGPTEGPLVERIPDLDPRQMLGSTFNFVVRTPQRLANLLHVLALLARTARILRARVAPGVTAAALAQAVEEHLESEPPP